MLSVIDFGATSKEHVSMLDTAAAGTYIQQQQPVNHERNRNQSS